MMRRLLFAFLWISAISLSAQEESMDSTSASSNASQLGVLNVREGLDKSHAVLIQADDFWKDVGKNFLPRSERKEVMGLAAPLMADSSQLKDTALSAWEFDKWLKDIEEARALIRVYSEDVDAQIDSLRMIYDKLAHLQGMWTERGTQSRTDSAVWAVWSEQIDQIQQQINRESESILDTINELSSVETELYQLIKGLNGIETSLLDLSSNDEFSLVKSDLPPLWAPEAREVSKTKLVTGWGTWVNEVQIYFRFNAPFFWRYFLFFIVSFFVLYGAKRYERRSPWFRDAQRFKVVRAWIYIPLASALVLAFFISRYIVFDTMLDSVSKPAVLARFEAMLAYVGLMALAWKTSLKRLRWLLLFPLAFFLLDGGILTAFGPSFTGRVLLLLEQLLFGAVLLYSYVQLRHTRSFRRKKWFKFVTFFTAVILVFQLISAVALAIGNYTVSRVFTLATFYCIANGLIIFFVNRGIPALLQAITTSPFGKRTHVVRELIGVNIRFFTLAAQYYLLGIYVMGLAKLLKFGEEIDQILNTLWNYSLTPTESLTITVSSLVEVLIVIMVVYFVAQFLQVIVRDEIASRLTYKKGLPLAYGVITKYIIFTIGFFSAVSVLGINLDRLGFVLGALGVGIGFGLQALVGNFIAGIVILFERPLRVGDIIKIGDKEGEVQELGARAIRVRLWEGAEELIPNYDVVTKNVTNWTLSDQLRRREAVFNVVPEAPVQEVLDILSSSTLDVEEIQQDPAPIMQFMGVQGSSAVYRCLFWVKKDYLRKDSEYRADVHQKLQDKNWSMSTMRYERKS